MSKYPVNEEMAAARDAVRAAEYEARHQERLRNRINIGGLQVGPPEPSEASRTLLKAVQDLTRALAAGGYDAAPGASQEGQALAVESLEATMKLVTFSDAPIQQFKKMPKALSGKRARITVDGKEIKGFGGGFSEIVWDWRFLTMPVTMPSRNVIMADIKDPGPDDALTITGGEPLTKKLVQDAARDLLQRSDGLMCDQIVVSPAQYKTYVDLMHDPYSRAERAMWFPPAYYTPRCPKCNALSPECACIVDAEATPVVTNKLSDTPDFELVPTPQERKRAALAKLDIVSDGHVGGCYVCAHPQRIAYPHRTTRMRFCADCAETLLA